jgi:carbonic anhydrase
MPGCSPAGIIGDVPEQRKAETLMVRCSDHRLARACEDFLENQLHAPPGSYDLLVVPGGPQFLCPTTYLPKFLWVGARWVRFLVEAHGIKRMVLIAHQDCGWYRQLFGPQLAPTDPVRKEKRQRQDLHDTRANLLQAFPDLKVEIFFARLQEPGVTFESVD